VDALEAVGDPELRATLLFARGRPRPVTADEIAADAGIHRNVARARLERLVEAGLLQSGYERRTGRTGPGAGRPAKTYSVAPEVEAIQFPNRRYESLFGLLLDTLPERDRERKLEAVGAAFGDELADEASLRPERTFARGVEALCAGFRRLGFQTSVAEIDTSSAVLATPTCPLRPLVQARAEAAAIDRGMWTGLAARALGHDVAAVACETRHCLADHASCHVLIQLRRF
jgi:predicted ArsR family transcriptional regulator